MPISTTAQHNHDQLFGNRLSALSQTDPELVEYFDNFAFDEVFEHGSLDPHTRLLVILASLIGCQAHVKAAADH